MECFVVKSKDLFDQKKNPKLQLDVKSVLRNKKIPKKEIKTMQKVKVRFSKVWDDNGTCYNKGITITEKTYTSLFGMIQAEGAREKDYYRALWLSTPIKSKGTVRFLNLTQANLVVDKLIKAIDIEINSQRALVDCNTYLVIK